MERMTGPVINPGEVAGPELPNQPSPITASFVNSFRISAVVDRLTQHIRGTSKSEVMEFFNLCLSLARGIDYAIANDEVPPRAPDLPLILKQVCQHRSDGLLQAAIMVLMISVKNACKSHWFSDKESDELHTIANEIGRSFSSATDINTEVDASRSTISTVMSRFYPRLQMRHILAFLEVKSGYGAYVHDFHISKDAKSSPDEKIHLFVAQTDNMETSSCIITPLHVNFLLNGKGVDRRTNVMMDTGPQNPTIVTHMLKYGTNLLQAVGQFNGNYIIVVAFMRVISDPVVPVLQDYVQPSVASLDADSEIIEGPSRISLNCPISFSRIKTPVKGHLCKHLQCFDLENFVDINSRRPSWRCPHCNQYVCFTDLRNDQNMDKVLKEVGETVTDVIISADGSWKAVIETDKPNDKQSHKTLISKLNVATEDTNSSNSASDILDLTLGDDPMDVISSVETEDRKPIVNSPSQSNPTVNISAGMYSNNPHIEDGFWSGIYLSACGNGSNSGSQVIGGVSESTLANNNIMLSPVLTDAVSPAVHDSFRSPFLDNSAAIQNQNYLQQQQLQQVNLAVNEYGLIPSAGARQVNRTPIAVQALAAPTQPPLVQPLPLQRSRTGLSGLSEDGPNSNSHTIGDGYNQAASTGGAHHFSRPQSPHSLQVSQMNSAALHQVIGSQSRGRQEQQQFNSTPQNHPLVSNLRGSTQIPSGQRPTEPAQPSRVQPLHMRTPSPGLGRSAPAHMQRTQVRTQPSPSSLNTQQNHMIGSGHQQSTIPMQRQAPSVPVSVQPTRDPSPLGLNPDRFRVPGGEQRSNMGGVGPGSVQQQPITRHDGSFDVTAEQNWRPTGRMRGSLSGRAYSDALNQFINIPSSQPNQPSRPSAPPGMGSQLHVLAANNRSAHSSSPQAGSLPTTEQADLVGGGSGFIPEASSGSGMNQQ